jgi:hypothetical protein
MIVINSQGIPAEAGLPLPNTQGFALKAEITRESRKARDLSVTNENCLLLFLC